jgi:hypothetical protein
MGLVDDPLVVTCTCMHGWGLGLAASVTIHGREHVVVAAAVYEAGMPAGLPLAIDALPALENVTNM